MTLQLGWLHNVVQETEGGSGNMTESAVDEIRCECVGVYAARARCDLQCPDLSSHAFRVCDRIELLGLFAADPGERWVAPTAPLAVCEWQLCCSFRQTGCRQVPWARPACRISQLRDTQEALVYSQRSKSNQRNQDLTVVTDKQDYLQHIMMRPEDAPDAVRCLSRRKPTSQSLRLNCQTPC